MLLTFCVLNILVPNSAHVTAALRPARSSWLWSSGKENLCPGRGRPRGEAVGKERECELRTQPARSESSRVLSSPAASWLTSWLDGGTGTFCLQDRAARRRDAAREVSRGRAAIQHVTPGYTKRLACLFPCDSSSHFHETRPPCWRMETCQLKKAL